MGIAAGSRPGPAARPSLPRWKSLLFQILLPLFGLLLVEIGLRIAGFEYYNIPRYIRFADDQYREQAQSGGRYDFVPDRSLFWRLSPDNPRLLTNARGYRGADFTEAKAAGVTRIIALGCSCTYGINASITYSAALQAFLNRNQAGNRYEVINAGVPGYTSFQGVRLFESELARYQPDIITVYFGWNDHWLARYYEDKNQKTPSRLAQFLMDHATRLRLLQALVRLSASVRGLRHPTSSTPLYRVSPADYRLNLERIIADAQGRGARVALITAPTAFEGPQDVPEYLVQDRFVTDPATAIALHRRYNDIVREVAREKDIPLIDCAAEFQADPGRKDLFGEDGIHPNNRGHHLIAVSAFRSFLQRGWIDPRDYRLEAGAAAGAARAGS